MDYEYKFPGGADCDPADCNTTAEYVGTTDTNNFTETPNEYTRGTNTELSTDNNVTTYESVTDCGKALDYTDTASYTDTVDYTHTTDTRDYSDIDSYEVTESNGSPEDETAATIDEWYTTIDKPASARERCKLDDYEIISDVLGAEKQIVKLYSTALCEAAEEPFRNLIKENLDGSAADQYKAFEFMQERGMYKTEQASETDITKAKQQFSPICKPCNCSDCSCDDNDCNN